VKALLLATQLDNLGGGAAAAARQLAAGLQRLGVDVVVVSTHRRPELAIDEQDGIRCYRFRPRNLYWIGDKDTKPAYQKAGFQLLDVWNPHVYRVVRAIIEREQPDVVHVHKLRGLSPSVWAAARAAGVRRIVHTCHDYELLSPEGTLSGRLGERAARGDRILWPYQTLRRSFSRGVALVTAPTCATLEQHTALGFFPRARQCIVPNSHGIWRAELEARRAPVVEAEIALPDRPARFLYLGRLETPKGIETLLAAFERAVAREPSLRLDVAGWGTLEDSLRARYRHLPQLHFHGTVRGEAKDALLASTDALLVPSIWREVFGIVIAEAFAWGKPVIGSHVGGISELVRDGETGFLVPAGDRDVWSEQILRAADAIAAVRRMAPACWVAAQRYTLDAVAEQYAAAYEAA
jgi:glycosyltransferase involved in cell wall biosynthesis